jgi:hypothetical protein
MQSWAHYLVGMRAVLCSVLPSQRKGCSSQTDALYLDQWFAALSLVRCDVNLLPVLCCAVQHPD